MAVDESVLVPTDAGETFTWLTDPDRLRRWQVIAARADLEVGGAYRYLITPTHTASGTFTEVEPGKRVAYTWGWEGDENVSPGSSTVTITLEPAAAGTRVRLVHEGLSDESAKAHTTGWTHYLERLVTATTTGDAGPDEWAGIPESPDQLAAAEAALAVCLAALRDLGTQQGTVQTPCVKFTVDDLVEHLLGTLTSLGAVAGGPGTAPADGTPESKVATAAMATLEAWRTRGLDGNVQLGPGEMPATLASVILSLELLVHGWDLAKAAGRSPAVSDELSAYVLELTRGLMALGLRDGERFAAEVPTGPGASDLERLVAFTGRAF